MIACLVLQATVNARSPQDVIAMARKYEVDKWLLNAVEKMAKRSQPVNAEDVQIVGLDDALKVAHVRERAMLILRGPSIANGRIDWKERSALDFKPTIMEIFGIGDSI